MSEELVDPYAIPTAYDILGLQSGVQATAKEIGKAYNKQKQAAKRIPDTKQRAARLEEIDRAKDQLQRPDQRVLVDFFQLSNDLFGDLASLVSGRLAQGGLYTEKIVGRFLAPRPYDDLLADLRDAELCRIPMDAVMDFAGDIEPAVRRAIFHVEL
jgi:hypothetical protein